MTRLSTAMVLIASMGLVVACGEDEVAEVETAEEAEVVVAEEAPEAAPEAVEAEPAEEVVVEAEEPTEVVAEEPAEEVVVEAPEAAEVEVIEEAGGGEAVELDTTVESDGEPVTAQVGDAQAETTQTAAADTVQVEEAPAAAIPAAAEEPEATAAGGTVHEVLMLNADPENPSERQVFEPPVLQIAVGDTVRFVSEDRGHNAVSNDDMIPEGGTEFAGAINEDIEVTFETEGTYGYHCTPHRSAGMVGLILVGDASVNFEEAREVRQRGQAEDRYDEYFAMAEEMIGEGS